MDDFRITANIEPTNKYEKAKVDVIKARNSINELTYKERERLLEELGAPIAIINNLKKLGII